MRSMTARLAVLAAILVSLAVPTMASATVSTAEINESLSKGVTYLKGLQSETTGEIAGFGGDWSLTSLAAAGTAATDVNKSGVAGRDARSWYESVVGAAGWPSGGLSTDYERGALDAYAAGIDPARVSKRSNLLAGVAGTYQPASPGYYGETFNGTVFGLLALADVKTTAGVKRFPAKVYERADRRGRSQPAHRRRLDLAESRGQRNGAEKRVRTGPDRRRDGGPLRRRRPQHRRRRSPRRRPTWCRSSNRKRGVQIGIRQQHRFQRLGGRRAESLQDRSAGK